MTIEKMNQPQPSDADLVARCLAGDTTAFGPLIDRSRTRLTRLLRLLLNNSPDFDDVWQETQRPMTYDLTKTLLDLGQVVVERVIVSRLHEHTFYGTMIVKTGSTVSEVDCRPSDAITLALRLDVPIFVASEIMDRESFTPNPDGTYTWAKYLDLKMRNAGTEQERDDLSKERAWSWQSVLAIDLDQVAQTHLETGEQAWQWIRGLDDEMMRKQTDLENRQFIANRIKVLLGRSLI
jgi:hypothetical protein